jgi:primosomal protein N' (replication factor Y) (superfamily II helicase)
MLSTASVDNARQDGFTLRFHASSTAKSLTISVSALPSAPTMSDPRILQVAIDTPLYRLFDYLPAHSGNPAVPGCRVRVPFGRTTTVGVVMAVSSHSDFPAHKLKRVIEVLDAAPLLPGDVLRLLNWAADYYQHPVGVVVAAAIPKLIREGQALDLGGDTVWQLTAAGHSNDSSALQRAPKQAALRDWLANTGPVNTDALAEYSNTWRPERPAG